MRILAINAYHGGSHREFLEQWQSHSDHEFTILSLPARHWKWRMQHAALTMAAEVETLCLSGQRWDVLWVTDMFDLATFLGLVVREVSTLPRIVYFHENQWTYPVPENETRDLTYGFLNLKTAITADEIWFNSDFHRRDFFEASRTFLQRMPDYAPLEQVAQCEQKSLVKSPGIQAIGTVDQAHGKRSLQILWAARWEYDKNPAQFCEAMRELDRRGVHFRLSVLGQTSPEVPDCLLDLKQQFQDRIDHWGFLEHRSDYLNALQQAEMVISAALHEFFGISVLEAVDAGCIPVLPKRLAYPELFEATPEVFYDGSTESLVEKVFLFSQSLQADSPHVELRQRLQKISARFHWSSQARLLDQGIETVRRNAELG